MTMMRVLRRLGITIVVAASVVGAIGFGVHDQAVGSLHALSVKPDSYLGAYVPGMPENLAGLTAFSSQTDTKPNVALYYSGWGEPFQLGFARKVSARGVIPLVQINPEHINLPDIYNGKYDSYLTSFAQSVRKLDHPVIISFGHEMNGNWYSWGNGNASPSDFVAAWRHIVEVFRSWGAFNVTWMWTINSLAGGPGVAAWPQAWWPGSSYVDWVGIDGYYYYRGESFKTLFGDTISAVRHFTKDPVLISETGISPSADKTALIPQVFAGVRSAGLLGVVYFDAKGVQDWRLDGNSSALTAFGKAARGFG